MQTDRLKVGAPLIYGDVVAGEIDRFWREVERQPRHLSATEARRAAVRANPGLARRCGVHG